MIRDPFRFYRVAPPAPTYGPVELPIVDVQSSLPSDFVANRVRQGGASFMRPVVGLMGQPQMDMVEMFTGVEQTPSEAMGISNPIGAFLTDAVLDPLNVGVTSIGGAMMRNSIRNPLRFLSRRELMPSANSMLPTMNELGEYIDPAVNTPRPSRRSRILLPPPGPIPVGQIPPTPGGWVRGNTNFIQRGVNDVQSPSRRSRILLPQAQNSPPDLLTRYNLARYGTENPVINKSRALKKKAIELLPNMKSKIKSMTDDEFRKTVISFDKGNLKLAYAPDDKEVAQYMLGKNKVKKIPVTDFIDRFNSDLQRLNEEIVPKVNRSGFNYEFLPMKSIADDFAEIGVKSVGPDGKETVRGWNIRINPGLFGGEVQNIAGKDYMDAIPGIRMTNTGDGVFDPKSYTPGSNSYAALNDYLKSMQLGRVSSGRSGLSDKGLKAWKTHIEKGRAIGFMNDINRGMDGDIFALMRTMNPYIAPTFGAGYGIGNYYRDNNR
jgi:hypothetical protein